MPDEMMQQDQMQAPGPEVTPDQVVQKVAEMDQRLSVVEEKEALLESVILGEGQQAAPAAPPPAAAGMAAGMGMGPGGM